ncbi:MAG: hypothetical protein AB7S44_04275 [Spirochaetales bacterium]
MSDNWEDTTCKLCGGNAKLLNGENGVNINCDNCDFEYGLVDYIFEDWNSIPDLKEKRANIIYSFLLRNGDKIKKGDGLEYFYKFFYNEEGVVSTNIAYKNIFNLLKDYPKNDKERIQFILQNFYNYFTRYGKGAHVNSGIMKLLLYYEPKDKDYLFHINFISDAIKDYVIINKSVTVGSQEISYEIKPTLKLYEKFEGEELMPKEEKEKPKEATVYNIEKVEKLVNGDDNSNNQITKNEDVKKVITKNKQKNNILKDKQENSINIFTSIILPIIVTVIAGLIVWYLTK